MTKLICALDTTDLGRAVDLAARLKPHVDIFKLGLEFFLSQSRAGYEKIAEIGAPIFLDLKLHDIPNTMAGGLRALKDLPNLAIITVHAAAGVAGIQRAKEEAKKLSTSPKIIAVTLLTSMDKEALAEIGVKSLKRQVLQLAGTAKKAGADGVVCSAKELKILRQEFGESLEYIIPGIRPKGAETGDQARIVTPQAAKKLGASYIVVGRPITETEKPEKAAQAIAKTLKS